MKRITLALPAPYVGLRPFDEKDALIFFGRDGHVRDLLAKLGNKQRFIVVLGASGTGKSSLVRAGLIPALHRGALASVGFQWKVYTFKPGDAPLHNLVHALTEDPRWIDNNTDRATAEASLCSLLAVSPLALTEQYRQRAECFGNEALLLVVDQFEEIFRYRQKNSDEAEAFIQLLLRTASEDVPIYVVMTMRSDFLGNCVAFFGLPEAINSGLYLTPRLGPDLLKSIIASPLTLVGGDIDPVLVTRLINTLGGDDELPILEHALLRMWNHAKDAGRNRIDMQDFEAVCAPHHAEQAGNAAKVVFTIDNHASSIFAALTEKQQQLAQQMFLALVENRDGRDVRRPQTFQQLTDLFGTHAQQDLQIIIDAFRAEQVGFLLPPFHEPIHAETLIDISHESLFRQWHLFQQWLKEEAFDISELKEWQQRAQRQQQGGGWLDENDCIRAQRWRERINTRADAKRWAGRYGEAGIYEQVTDYIDFSMHRLHEIKDEHERLEREKQEAVTKQLEAEARLQRESAERAEKEKLQAENFAKASRRRSVIATIAAVIAIAFAVVSGVFYSLVYHEKTRAEKARYEANAEKERAEKMAREARAGKMVATAENLINSNPDQAVLLGLAARQVSAIPKIDALLRFAQVNFKYHSVLRGHEAAVLNAQFSADGKTIVTASWDNTARVWDAVTGKELYALRGHEAAVLNAQFSADGKTIVTASWDNTARVWDAVTGKELYALRGHEAAVLNAQFSADGKTIVTASWDNTARVWDAVSEKELHALRGHEAAVLNAQFSADGKTIVTASWDNTARVWDAVTGKVLHTLRGHAGEVLSAQFSVDGKTIVTASEDKTARVWDAVSGKELHSLSGLEAPVSSAQFSSDDKTIVIVSRNKDVHVWDAVSGKVLHTLRGHVGEVLSAQFSPDGKTIVTASVDKTARMWDATTGKELFTLRGHEDDVLNVQFSVDGKAIVTSSKDRSVRVWNVLIDNELLVFSKYEGLEMSVHYVKGGYKVSTSNRDDMTERVWKMLFGEKLDTLGVYTLGDSMDKVPSNIGEVPSTQFSMDGKKIATVSWNQSVRIWDALTGKELYTLSGHKDWVWKTKFSADSKAIVTASWDNTARVWDAVTGKELHALRGHEAAVLNAQFSVDGKTIVTASEDKTARVWDTVTGKELHTLRGHESAVLNAQFSVDGKTIVTASLDKTARVWDAVTGKELHILQEHEAAVLNAQFSADGKTIVTASWDNTARVWDALTGMELYALTGHEAEVLGAQFSLDGKMIVTASMDKTARLWDALTGMELHKLSGHEDVIRSAQFSPDSRMIVTTSRDNTARVWDALTGMELYKLSEQRDEVLSAQFSSDGQMIVTASGNKSVGMWRCEVCRPVEEIAAELQKRVGRELTVEERRRFGVPDSVSLAN